MATPLSRPTGVTILVVLEVLGGIISIGGGLLLFGVAAIVRGIFGLIALVLGVVIAILGAISLFLAYGLWNAKGWAWTWALIFAIIGAIFAIVGLAQGHVGNILSLIINGVIIYYLNTPHVKAFFGKAPMATPPPAPA